MIDPYECYDFKVRDDEDRVAMSELMHKINTDDRFTIAYALIQLDELFKDID